MKGIHHRQPFVTFVIFNKAATTTNKTKKNESQELSAAYVFLFVFVGRAVSAISI